MKTTKNNLQKYSSTRDRYFVTILEFNPNFSLIHEMYYSNQTAIVTRSLKSDRGIQNFRAIRSIVIPVVLQFNRSFELV